MHADVAAALTYLEKQAFVRPGEISTWGFCMGGAVAFETATLPGLHAAICFYGGSIAAPFPNGEPGALAEVQDIRCPLLLVFGGNDSYITPEKVDEISRALTAAHKKFQLQVYPEQDHAFFRDSTAAMKSNPDVAHAWALVQTFLSETATAGASH
jgi:carboxymethylenebutenolidase